MWSGPSRSGEPRRTAHVAEFLRHSDASFGETRLRAIAALAWEFWAANRRGWLLVLAAIATCAFVSRIVPESLQQSEALRFFCFMPMVMSLILAAAFCNFTDHERRDGIAGFPRHLFTLPVSTVLLVTCAIACTLISVVGVYAAWVLVVLEPIEIDIPLQWPATLLAAFVVFYQAVVWCLCGFRLTRVIVLSLMATTLVAVACLPTLLPKTDFWASELNLTAALAALATAAYAATLSTVAAQRRGGARGWTGLHSLLEFGSRALPRWQPKLKSADAALFWLEWRRAGLVLPTAVTLTMCLILGPVLWFTGRGEKEMLWAETWLVIMPIALAFPIGLGFGKPDFWSLDLKLSTFIATRPVTAGQLLAAKMKTAAWSTFAAWLILLAVAPACIYLYCDTTHLAHMWASLGILYSPFSRWAVPLLALIAAVLITWSLLVRSLWLGYSGRSAVYYSLAGVGIAAFVTAFIFLLWWLDHPRSRGDVLVGMLPWLPWALATIVTVKTWTALYCARTLNRSRLISGRSGITYASIWLAATACLVLYAWLMAPRIEWFRNTAALAGLAAIPCVSITLAPFAIAANRHR